jgi:vacuolar-type H+-ATPase subunit I/STV1
LADSRAALAGVALVVVGLVLAALGFALVVVVSVAAAALVHTRQP